MRAREFIVERSFPERKSATMQGTKVYPGMPSANPYEIYRFGMAMANHEMKDANGPTDNFAVISPYAKEEDAIVQAAERKTGQKGQLVADEKSHEPNSTNTVSPVAKPKKNKYGV